MKALATAILVQLARLIYEKAEEGQLSTKYDLKCEGELP